MDKCDMEQNSMTDAMFKDEVLKLKRAELAAAGKNPHAAQLPCRTTLYNMKCDLKASRVEKPSLQTVRRLQVSWKMSGFSMT